MDLEDLIEYYNYKKTRLSEGLLSQRNQLLKACMDLGMPASKLLKHTEPMKDMTEEEKEAFAKSLREKLERGEITPS